MRIVLMLVHQQVDLLKYFFLLEQIILMPLMLVQISFIIPYKIIQRFLHMKKSIFEIMQNNIHQIGMMLLYVMPRLFLCMRFLMLSPHLQIRIPRLSFSISLSLRFDVKIYGKQVFRRI